MVKRYSNNSVFLAALICIIVFYSGLLTLKDRNSFCSSIKKEDINFLQGILISSPAKTSDGRYYYSKMNVSNCAGYICNSYSLINGSAFGNIKVYIPSELVEAFYPGKLYSKAKAFNNSQSFQTMYEAGGSYSLEGKFSGDGQSFYVNNCINAGFPQNFYGRFDYLRALCRLQFKRLMYSWGAGGGLLLALLCGAKEYTSSEVSLSFKNAGLSHILALSGMHLSMFSGIALFAGKKIGRKKLSFIIRIIALLLFVWFAGFSPSLLRAFLCSFFMIIAALANVEKPDLVLILAFSFLCQTIISPSDIYNSGFILSYSALAGILLTNKFFRSIYNKCLPGYFSNSLGSSTGAQFFTAPVSLSLFGTFAPVGIVATSVVSPVVTIFIYSGLFLIVLCLLIPALSVPSGIFINFEYNVIKLLTGLFSLVPVWRIN